MTKLKTLLIAGVLILFFQACKKEDGDKGPIPTKGQLKIALNNTYLPASKIDSAFLIWSTLNGQDSASFNLQGNSLVLETEALPQEQKNYQVALMTSAKLGYNKLKWDKTFTATFQPASSLTIQGPQTIQDSNWLPRVILDDHTGLIAFSGVRPTDAYFSFFRVDPLWQSIDFDRSYWNNRGGVHRVAGSVWHGIKVFDNNGMYVNNSFFSFLPNQIGTQTWNHLEIFILFSTVGNEQMRGLSFTHDF